MTKDELDRWSELQKVINNPSWKPNTNKEIQIEFEFLQLDATLQKEQAELAALFTEEFLRTGYALMFEYEITKDGLPRLKKEKLKISEENIPPDTNGRVTYTQRVARGCIIAAFHGVVNRATGISIKLQVFEAPSRIVKPTLVH